VGSDDNYIYAIWGRNGSVFWEYNTADDVMHLQLGDISGDGAPNIGAITFGFDGIVYAFASLGLADINPPIITNIHAFPIPGGDQVNITCQVTDIGGSISSVWLTVTNPLGETTNVSMVPFGGNNIYYYNESFSLIGGYDFIISAEDGVGNTNSSQPMVLMRQAVFSEWNLVTVPTVNGWSAETLGENITGCTTVSMWNASLQTYDTYIVGGPPTFDFTITCGMGLFVDVTTESTWLGEG